MAGPVLRELTDEQYLLRATKTKKFSRTIIANLHEYDVDNVFE